MLARNTTKKVTLMKFVTPAATFVLLAAPAFAETQLEQFEVLAEEMNVAMLNMMANEIEGQGGDATALRALDGMMPPWTDEIREAASCMLDAYTAEIGSDGIDTMLADMREVMPQLSGITMTEADEQGLLDNMAPEGISLEQSTQISQSCGMLELQMQASRESGFMEAMMAAGATVPQ